MMYTSQSGDLYVGQARALGAVGVLPKQIKPVEVTDGAAFPAPVGGLRAGPRATRQRQSIRTFRDRVGAFTG
jgi:hypothetical protein